MTVPQKLFSVLELPLLSELLGAADLTLVDVGGRGSAVAALLPLARFARYVVCEPDVAEAGRLREQLPQAAPWRDVTVITEAMAPQCGEAVLHVTAEPGMSSLLEPDAEVAGRYCLRTRFRVDGTQTVRTMPLDAAAEHYGFADATFLKLDTQGTELAILQSAPRLVSGSLLGVYTESLFQPFYKGQSLFADVDHHLRGHGFTLLSLQRTTLRRARYRKALYSRRVAAWAHCLYLREPGGIGSDGGDGDRRQLARLLALVLAFQFFDIAFEIAGQMQALELLTATDSARLTDEIERCAVLATRHIQHKARERGLLDVVMAPTFRDKSQLE